MEDTETKLAIQEAKIAYIMGSLKAINLRLDEITLALTNFTSLEASKEFPKASQSILDWTTKQG